jgi:acetyl esterase/lipase
MRTLSSFLMSCVAVMVPHAATATTRPPAQAFASLPTFSSSALSADGNKIAFGAPRADGNLDIRIFDFPTRTTETINLTTNKLRSLQFEDGGKLLVYASFTSNDYTQKVEDWRMIAIDIGKKTTRQISGSVQALLPDQPNKIVLADYEQGANFGAWTLNLYTYDLETNRAAIIEKGTSHTRRWLTDRLGNPIARIDLNLVGKFTTMHVKKPDGSWDQVIRMDNTPTLGMWFVGQSASGRILFQRDDKSEFGKVEALNLATGAVSVHLRTVDTPLSGMRVDPWTGQLAGVSLGGLEPMQQWIAPEFGEAQAMIEAQLPDRKVQLIDHTPDRKILLAVASASASPSQFYILNLNASRLSSIGTTMPSLTDVAMGNQRATTFKSRDGVDIPVYVTTPPGHNDAKNAPTVVFPHGGPAARDHPGFDWWAQFMASRGYVVIQPQFRGSTGFGNAFAEAGKRQWGKRMQDDVSDALGWAIKEGLTDPARACIVGASYGGYAALAGATMTPDLYKCAISVAGVSDLPQMLIQQGAGNFGARSEAINYWTDHIGADDRAAMEAASPRRLAANAKAPILLIHGKDDSVVLFNQSEMMANALRLARKSVSLVQLDGEDHWLSRPSTRLKMLEEIDRFLLANLGAGVEAK